MNAWMRLVWCACGTGVAVGFGSIAMGCSGAHTIRAQVTPLGVFVDYTFEPLIQSDQYDLDGLPYRMIKHEGISYRFYPGTGWIYDPITGRLYQLDDASWQRMLDQLGIPNQPLENSELDTSIEKIQRETFGLCTPNLKAGMGFSDEHIAMELNLLGDTPMPFVDEDRWPSLHHELYVFPDGVQGSADQMRLELAGEPSDVLGYMASLGVTDGTTTIDGHEWSVVIVEDQWADVFMDDVLFTSVLLH